MDAIEVRFGLMQTLLENASRHGIKDINVLIDEARKAEHYILDIKPERRQYRKRNAPSTSGPIAD